MNEDEGKDTYEVKVTWRCQANSEEEAIELVTAGYAEHISEEVENLDNDD